MSGSGTAPRPRTSHDDDRLARAALTRVAEPAELAVVLAVREAGATAVWAALRERRPWPVAGLAPAARAALEERLPATDPVRDLERADRVGARFLVPGDPEWPEGLDDLTGLRAEPLGLWARGPLDARATSARAVSVVGSRSASGYGQHVAGELAAQLVDLGRAVVSGGAYGIDGAAHRGALAAGGATVAVMANGVDVHYPRGHEALLRRIAEEGLLLTELPPGCAPQRHRFLTRNRVIAALGAGTVVVEAGLRSGARSTASRAQDLGRPTMAVPGPVTSATSAGCHVLLRSGATLVTRAAEVLEEVGRIGVDLAEERRGPDTWRDALSQSVRRVLEAVPVGSWAGPAQIARVAGVDQLTVLRSLGPLEREGLVRSGPAGYRQAAEGRSPG